MRLQDEVEQLVEVLRSMAEAYPEHIFPGPPISTTNDGIAGAALRNVAAPKLTEAACMIERLFALLQDVAINHVLDQQQRCPYCGEPE